MLRKEFLSGGTGGQRRATLLADLPPLVAKLPQAVPLQFEVAFGALVDLLGVAGVGHLLLKREKLLLTAMRAPVPPADATRHEAAARAAIRTRGVHALPRSGHVSGQGARNFSEFGPTSAKIGPSPDETAETTITRLDPEPESSRSAAPQTPLVQAHACTPPARSALSDGPRLVVALHRASASASHLSCGTRPPF